MKHLEVEFKTIEQPVRLVMIEGHSYVLNDLFQTMEDIYDGHWFLENDDIGKLLLKLNVVKDLGTSWHPGRHGENFAEFYDLVCDWFFNRKTTANDNSQQTTGE